MNVDDSIYEQIEQDIWSWINNFITVANEFYNYKFPPCPFARQAVLANTVDVQVWRSGNVRDFIKEQSIGLRDSPALTTRVIVFSPRTRYRWGINDYVEQLNAEMIADNVFLNTGVTKTTTSRYPGSSSKEPYFIVIANSLDAVMAGSKSLLKTDYYANWPAEHFEHVVERRARMAKKYGRE
jgi:hypothetical protein